MTTHRMTRYRCLGGIKLGEIPSQKCGKFLDNIVVHTPVLPLLLGGIKVESSTCLNREENQELRKQAETLQGKSTDSNAENDELFK